MRISGFTLGDFKACTEQVSEQTYYGNVIVSNDSYDRVLAPACTARLAVADSRGPGSRTAAAKHPRTGNRRHGPWACWHAYRDVFAELFHHYPDAVIVSGHAWRVTYRHRDGFERTYPRTASVNVGSQLEPVTMPELCACSDGQPAVPAVPVHRRVPDKALFRLRDSATLFADHIDETVFGPYNGAGIR